MGKSFADSLKSLRTTRGMSQQQLADMLYVDRSTVANWESGRRVPNAIQIANIASVFNTEVSMLMKAASSMGLPPPRPITFHHCH